MDKKLKTIALIAHDNKKPEIVEWAKNLLASCPFCNGECEVVEEDFVAEEPAAEEVAVEEPAPEVVVAENEPVAEEADFAE